MNNCESSVQPLIQSEMVLLKCWGILYSVVKKGFNKDCLSLQKQSCLITALDKAAHLGHIVIPLQLFIWK